MKAAIYNKYIIPSKERTFACEDHENIHYLFFKKKSDVLIIGLQAFNAKGPRYSYVTSLTGIKASRLYIKDDFVEKSGNYYLGRNGQYNIEADVFHLIDRFIEQTGARKLIFIGSSKGGYSAINFGLNYEGASIIAGAPQYYLGRYMQEARKFNKGLEDIVGSPVTPEKVEALNIRLKNKIYNNEKAKTQKLFIHCSTQENTYDWHAKDLISDCRQSGMAVSFDAGNYPNHADIKYYFPAYLYRVLVDEIKRRQ